ncbi:MAG: hypothetical protein U0X73_06255 [Thermoanaerobaculia bacterium]
MSATLFPPRGLRRIRGISSAPAQRMSLPRSSRIGLLAALAATMVAVYGVRSVAYRRWLGARGARHPPAAAKRELKPEEVDPALFRPNPAPFAAVRTEKGGIRTPEPRAKALVWGRDPDEFGGIPDAEGFYSQKLHFDLSASDPIRRAQFLLERNARGELELLLSKQDLEKMPTLDQVLQRVEGPDDRLDATGRYVDPLLPRFHRLAEIAPGEVGSWQARDVAPSPGGDHLLRISYRVQGPDDDDPDEGPFLLECLAAPSGSVAWRSEVYYADRFEFAADNPDLFYYLDTARGGGVYSLAEGLICALPGASAVNRGHYAAWPTFVNGATALSYGFGDRIESIDLSTCGVRQFGEWTVNRRGLTGAVSVTSLFSSLDGRAALASAREEVRGAAAPNGRRPFRAAYVTTVATELRDGEATERTVFGRLFNNLLGIEGAVLESVPNPFLTVNQLRSRDGPFELPGQRGMDFHHANVCFLLVRNAHGRFFALSLAEQSHFGLELDRQRGLVRFRGAWWSLRPLADWNADDEARE